MDTMTRMCALMKQRGIKQAFINEAIGGYRGKMTDWKHHKSSPNAAELARIADILDTTVAYLRCETDDPAPDKEEARLESRAAQELERLGVLRPDGTWDEAKLERLRKIAELVEA